MEGNLSQFASYNLLPVEEFNKHHLDLKVSRENFYTLLQICENMKVFFLESFVAYAILFNIYINNWT